MEKKDKLTLIVFIFLIVAIIFVVGVNSYKNRKLNDVDRKIEYIMGYSYDTVLNKGYSLFFQTVNLLNNSAFDYARNLDQSIRYYSINEINNYIKINNFSLAINNFSENGLKEFMEYKKIIYFENNYFMEDKKLNTNNYIGSIIDIEKYDESSVLFKSVNYFCDNFNYLGILYEEPNCNYLKEESTFTVVFENNMFKINSINDFKFLIK